MRHPNYFNRAQTNEVVFRNILRDLKQNKTQRLMGVYIPDDLETEAPLESIFEKYSLGERYGIFTITDFVVDGETATISFKKDTAFLSGGGAGLIYTISGETVEYDNVKFVMLS